MVQDQVFGDIHTRPSHPELEAAAIAVITTFQVSRCLNVLESSLIPDWTHYQRSWTP
jgi:hypothetical protein